MDILNKIKEIVSNRHNELQYKSSYMQFGNKLIRVANHLPKESNIDYYNDGVEHVLLVMVDDEYNSTKEIEIERFCESSDYETEYLHLEKSDEFNSYCEMILNNFLN